MLSGTVKKAIAKKIMTETTDMRFVSIGVILSNLWVHGNLLENYSRDRDILAFPNGKTPRSVVRSTQNANKKRGVV